ncbi:MAG: hypothetical protein K2H46_02480 [Muribaculaceae bacterium]|nr:hypothetical protein [Muribaculaceae bacterium]
MKTTNWTIGDFFDIVNRVNNSKNGLIFNEKGFRQIVNYAKIFGLAVTASSIMFDELHYFVDKIA